MRWQNTQEGSLADSMYAVNREFAGWRLVGPPALGTTRRAHPAFRTALLDLGPRKGRD